MQMPHILAKRILLFLVSNGLAVGAFGADSAQSFSAQGQLIVQSFASAPFPHPERAEGHKYKEEFYSAAEHYSDSTVAIFIPKGFRETGKIDFVVHFHGWRNHVDEVLRTTRDENLRMIEDTVAFVVKAGRRVIYDAEHFFAQGLT